MSARLKLLENFLPEKVNEDVISYLAIERQRLLFRVETARRWGFLGRVAAHNAQCAVDEFDSCMGFLFDIDAIQKKSA